MVLWCPSEAKSKGTSLRVHTHFRFYFRSMWIGFKALFTRNETEHRLGLGRIEPRRTSETYLGDDPRMEFNLPITLTAGGKFRFSCMFGQFEVALDGSVIQVPTCSGSEIDLPAVHCVIHASADGRGCTGRIAPWGPQSGLFLWVVLPRLNHRHYISTWHGSQGSVFSPFWHSRPWRCFLIDHREWSSLRWKTNRDTLGKTTYNK